MNESCVVVVLSV